MRLFKKLDINYQEKHNQVSEICDNFFSVPIIYIFIPN